MKLKLIVVATFCLISMVANSATGDTPSFTIIRTDDASRSIFLVTYKGNKVSNIRVVIKDASEKEVLTKLIKGTKDFLLPINFSSVDEGSYTIQIDNGNEKLIQTLVYTNEKAPTYSHVVSLGDNRYLFTSSHAGTEKITIRIYDGGGSLVYEKGEVIKGDFAKLLNLKSVIGTPVFEVVENSGTYIMVLRNPTTVDVGK
jgi:hypothetical protein